MFDTSRESTQLEIMSMFIFHHEWDEEKHNWWINESENILRIERWCMMNAGRRDDWKKSIWFVFAAFMNTSLVVCRNQKRRQAEKRKTNFNDKIFGGISHLDEIAHENDLEKRWRDIPFMCAVCHSNRHRRRIANFKWPFCLWDVACVVVSLRLFCYYFSHFRLFGCQTTTQLFCDYSSFRFSMLNEHYSFVFMNPANVMLMTNIARLYMCLYSCIVHTTTMMCIVQWTNIQTPRRFFVYAIALHIWIRRSTAYIK